MPVGKHQIDLLTENDCSYEWTIYQVNFMSFHLDKICNFISFHLDTIGNFISFHLDKIGNFISFLLDKNGNIIFFHLDKIDNNLYIWICIPQPSLKMSVG